MTPLYCLDSDSITWLTYAFQFGGVACIAAVTYFIGRMTNKD